LSNKIGDFAMKAIKKIAIFFWESFQGGFFAVLAAVAVIILLNLISYAGKAFTDNYFFQILIGLIFVLTIGVIIKKVKKSKFKWILRILPHSVIDKPEVRWPNLDGGYSFGLLVGTEKIGTEEMAKIIELNAGPVSVTGFLRCFPWQKNGWPFVEKTGRNGQQLIAELMTFGGARNSHKQS